MAMGSFGREYQGETGMTDRYAGLGAKVMDDLFLVLDDDRTLHLSNARVDCIEVHRPSQRTISPDGRVWHMPTREEIITVSIQANHAEYIPTEKNTETVKALNGRIIRRRKDNTPKNNT